MCPFTIVIKLVRPGCRFCSWRAANAGFVVAHDDGELVFRLLLDVSLAHCLVVSFERFLQAVDQLVADANLIVKQSSNDVTRFDIDEHFCFGAKVCSFGFSSSVFERMVISCLGLLGAALHWIKLQ